MSKETEKKRIEQEAMVQYSLVGIKGIIFVNGGAAVALLAFLGHVIGKGDTLSQIAEILKHQNLNFMYPMLFFMAGAGFGLIVAASMSYVQYLFWEEKKCRKIVRGGLNFFLVIGIVCFFCGGYLAIKQFDNIIKNFPIK
jgi:hypothetical protein